MRINKFLSILLLSSGTMIGNSAVAEDTFHAQLSTDISSRYVAEGRDVLDGSSLSGRFLEMSWGNFFNETWYATSPGEEYNELNVFFGVTETFGDMETYLFYAYKHFDEEEDNYEDNEVGVGISTSNLPADLTLSVDGYHSFDADGSFWEVALSRDFNLGDRWTWSPSGILGINRNYIADGHDGSNHLALKVDAEYALSPSLSVIAFASYNWAINTDASSYADDELLFDFFNGGVGIQWSFSDHIQ